MAIPLLVAYAVLAPAVKLAMVGTVTSVVSQGIEYRLNNYVRKATYRQKLQAWEKHHDLLSVDDRKPALHVLFVKQFRDYEIPMDLENLGPHLKR